MRYIGAFATLPAVVAQQVRVDYNHGADFSRITSAVDEGLAKKGLHRVESGGDLVVTYQGAVQNQIQLTTFTDGGRRVGDVGSAVQATCRIYKSRSKILDKYQPKSNS